MAPKLLYLSALALLAGPVFSQQIIVPPHSYPGETTNTQWISGPDDFDAPKNRPINQTTFDWWYFDAVQEPNERGEQASFAITFHTSGPHGFDTLQDLFPLGSPSDNLIQINLAWPNGDLDFWILAAGEAVFTINGNSASAVFAGTGCSFEGVPDLSHYSVHIDAPDKGIVGSLDIKSDVPAHYPCGPAEEGQDMHVVPGVGWLNAIPDGLGEADFQIRGKEFKFQGRGYHDHNYGSRPFSESAASAYWGHGRLGEYAIVWLSVLTPTGSEHVSAYVTKNSEIIVAHCEGIKIRPYGDNSTYPPTRKTGAPTGFRIEITIPEGQLELAAEYIYIQVGFDFYRRFTGTFTGTLNGEPLPDGVALWEQFSLN
ncbi:hypothetical protein BDW59DRAFT_173782 [Aspergillus cavernicola]|uniref:Hydroxyneurosporene synthase n=1 Tax=Aspergillus cavernicola TaxID=176166 RepID=A0ABR4I4L2_9EURO